jgi:hypothetical protein
VRVNCVLEEKSPGKRLNLKNSMDKIFRRNSKGELPVIVTVNL